MAKEMSKDEIVKYIINHYSLDKYSDNIDFDKAGEVLQFYLDSYKKEFFENKFEYILLHKYYKDFLEEVMPVIENVNTLYDNGASLNFNLDLYQKATLANKLNKKIIERVISLIDENSKESNKYNDLLNLANIKDNNIFKKESAYETNRAAHELPHMDYSKEHTDSIRAYFITTENYLKKELLKVAPECEINFLEDLLNVIYEYNIIKEKSEIKSKTL